MGSGNKNIRKRLEKKYGKKDMFVEANVEQKIDEMNKLEKKKIRTYKQYKKKCKYKRNKVKLLEKRLSLHHLKHRSEMGKTTEENGAIVAILPHSYLHSLPREQEEVINNMLREYKKTIDIAVAEVKAEGVKQATVISLPEVTEDCIEIPIETMTPEEQAVYEKHKRERNARIYKKFGVDYEQEL